MQICIHLLKTYIFFVKSERWFIVTSCKLVLNLKVVEVRKKKLMAGYNRHLSSDPNFLLEYMENMSDSDSDSDFDRYVDNPELDSEEEECSTSSFQNYPSHLSGLATSCPPAPPPSMSASLTPTHTHSTVLASSVLSTALILTVAPSNSLAPAVVPSTVLAPSASSIVLGLSANNSPSYCSSLNSTCLSVFDTLSCFQCLSGSNNDYCFSGFNYHSYLSAQANCCYS